MLTPKLLVPGRDSLVLIAQTTIIVDTLLIILMEAHYAGKRAHLVLMASHLSRLND